MKLYEGTAIEVSACGFLLNCSIYPAIYEGFVGWGVHQMFWGPIFDGRNEILLLGKALKFKIFFQKLALKLIKSWTYFENSRKMQSFVKSF